MSEKIRSLLKNITKDYQLSITDKKRLTQVFSLRISKLKIILATTLFAIVVVMFALLLVFLTPLRFYAPGYPSQKEWKAICYNAMMLDSMRQQIEIRDKYLENIRTIIKGEVVQTSIDSGHIASEVSLTPMKNDSIFDQLIRTDQYKFKIDKYEDDENLTKIDFFKPASGLVINRFEASPGHYGTDIVGTLHSNIFATLDGVVVFAEWSVSTGYVVIIQHGNNLISVYKHNSDLLIKQGDKVTAGQVIAIMGSEGELSSGPHLHFELWHNGKPLDPQKFINF